MTSTQRLVVVMVAVVLAAGCSSDDIATPSSTSSTFESVAGSMTPDGDVADDAICHDLPQGCTPRPTDEQARVIERQIAAVYPGLPEGKATDWAIYTCDDARRGMDSEALVEQVTRRYAGGDRPDPVRAQAVAILGVIERSGFCDGLEAPATTTTTASVPPGGFPTCTEAAAAGFENIAEGDPGYSRALDPDGDGVACERSPGS